MRVSLLLAVAALTLSVPAGAQETAAGAPAPAPANYRISVGDTLSIAVPGEQNFTRDCQVSGAGTISYPNLGDIAAVGLTCDELTARLRTGLARYLRRPVVTVTVKQYGTAGMNVYVMGDVKNPGSYPIANGSGFLQAIAAAGGLTELASGEISVSHGTTTSVLRLSDVATNTGAAAQVGLQPGDVIYVLRKKEARYTVLGEVPKPGMFEMPLVGEVRVIDALAQAGVIAPNPSPSGGAQAQPATAPRSPADDPSSLADFEHAKLVRNGTEAPVNIRALLHGDVSQNLLIQPGDVLQVPPREAIEVYALGEVKNAGRHYLRKNATVLDLVSDAGGPTAQAKAGEATLVRRSGDKPTTMAVDLEKLYGKGDAAQNVPLQAGDVLYVPSRGEPSQTKGQLLNMLSILLWRL